MSMDIKKQRITELNCNILGAYKHMGSIQTYAHTSHTTINIWGNISKEFVPLWARTIAYPTWDSVTLGVRIGRGDRYTSWILQVLSPVGWVEHL